jgi:hypothetical protein
MRARTSNACRRTPDANLGHDGGMAPLARATILLLRFGSELAALTAFTLWGFSESGWFGVLPPLAAAAVWGRWMAPMSQRRLEDPLRLLAELTFFSLATGAFDAVGAKPVAAVYAAVAFGSAALVRLVGEPQIEPGAKPAA